MGKKPYPGCSPTKHTLIIRNTEEEALNGLCTPGDIDHARMLARDLLRTYPQCASVDIYAFDKSVIWRDLQPLETVIDNSDEFGRSFKTVWRDKHEQTSTRNEAPTPLRAE